MFSGKMVSACSPGHREAQLAVGIEPGHRANGPNDAREHRGEDDLAGQKALLPSSSEMRTAKGGGKDVHVN